MTRVAYFTSHAVTRIKYQSTDSSLFLFFIYWVWWHFVKLSILLPLPSWLIDWSVDTICLKNPQPLPWLLVQLSVETHSIKKEKMFFKFRKSEVVNRIGISLSLDFSVFFFLACFSLFKRIYLMLYCKRVEHVDFNDTLIEIDPLAHAVNMT